MNRIFGKLIEDRSRDPLLLVDPQVENHRSQTCCLFHIENLRKLQTMLKVRHNIVLIPEYSAGL